MQEIVLESPGFFPSRSTDSRKGSGASQAHPLPPTFFAGLLVILEPCAEFLGHTNIKKLQPSLLSPTALTLLKPNLGPPILDTFHGFHSLK